MPAKNKSPAKTADRPHVITVLLGLLSPSLAIVALYVSQQAMKVGQRAYLSIEEPMATVDRIANSDYYRVIFDFDICNQGNTPGTIRRVHYRFEADEGKNLVSFDQQPTTLKNVVEITDPAPEEDVQARSKVRRQTQAVVMKLPSSGLFPKKANSWFPVRVLGTLTYRDVFQKEDSVTWCWRPMTGQQEPMKCEKTP